MTYLKFSIATFISVQALTYQNQAAQANSALTIVLTVLVCLAPMFTYLFIQLNFTNLQEDSFKLRFKSLYLNIKTKSREALFTSTIFVTRRLVFAIVVVFLRHIVVLQLFI